MCFHQDCSVWIAKCTGCAREIDLTQYTNGNGEQMIEITRERFDALLDSEVRLQELERDMHHLHQELHQFLRKARGH